MVIFRVVLERFEIVIHRTFVKRREEDLLDLAAAAGGLLVPKL